MIAIVPMKEHSERVPGKNIRNFNGKPLFYWIMESLFRTKSISRVVLNTDSLLTGNMAQEHFPAVQVFYRPDCLRGDMVTGNALIEWTLRQLAGEHFLYTHATNPLLKMATINSAIGVYFDNLDKYDSLFGVTKHKMRLFKAGGMPLNHDPSVLTRTQEIDPLYEDNSTMYIFSRESFKATSSRIGEKPYMFEVSKIEAIDIDTEEDWRIAEAVAKCRDGWK